MSPQCYSSSYFGIFEEWLAQQEGIIWFGEKMAENSKDCTQIVQRHSIVPSILLKGLDTYVCV